MCQSCCNKIAVSHPWGEVSYECAVGCRMYQAKCRALAIPPVTKEEVWEALYDSSNMSKVAVLSLLQTANIQKRRLEKSVEFLTREIEKLQEYCLKLEESNKRILNDSVDKNTRLFNSEQENKRLVADNFRLQTELDGLRKMWGAIK